MTSIVVAVIAAVASITAAVVAGVFAMASRRHELRVQRADAARERNIEDKRAMYGPVVDLLDRMFTTDDLPTAEEQEHKRRFDRWVNVYGSDGVVAAYGRLMQALPHNPPADLQFRLYGDFLLEVRKDLGDPASRIGVLHILGPRLNGVGDPRTLTDPDLDAVCGRLGWTPPWALPK
ncbi:hypothetical protein [Saccharomonospora xinjiangensis]|uniref:Uncharacterized protein n=1 Tax=Saccharomonospora xinjiangensis XJ-54 TaxID=882086 RepID=I0V7C0_9PSEU|nr:hypothetical protein [Saccharomonospora xinjiangensis]EID56023.1 hypothetical protein SacxiDRAFT_3831 [Saccharomonospora xinjiangensis XJ-54]